MASLNKVFLIGNLTRNPEVRYTNSGSAVCEFGLAINRTYVSNGVNKDETCFVDISVWGAQAESCGRYLQKGAPVFVEGRLKFDQWQDKESGKSRSKLRIVGERVQFLGSPGRKDNFDADSNSSGYNQQQENVQAPQSPIPRQEAPQPAPAQAQQFQQEAPAPAQQFQQAAPAMPQAPFEVDSEPDDDIPF